MFTKSNVRPRLESDVPVIKKQKIAHSPPTLFQQRQAVQDLQQGKPNVNPAHLPEISAADNQNIINAIAKQTIIDAYLRIGLLATFRGNSIKPNLSLLNFRHEEPVQRVVKAEKSGL